MKKFLFLLVPLLLTSCGANNPKDKPIDFSLSVDKNALKINEKANITVTLNDEKDKERANFTYATSDETILKPVSFENNILLVSAVSVGKAIISVTETTFATTKSIDIFVTSELGKTTIMQNYKDYTDNIIFGNYSSTPINGNVKLLVIPVWFTDSSTYITDNQKKEYVRDDIEAAYLGSNEEVGYRSVKTYYEEESGRKLNISGKVTNWFDTNEPSSNYDYSSLQTRVLLQNAVEWAVENEGVNRSDYDSDNDGYIDAVILIYARPDYYAKREEENNFWAYCSRDTTSGSDKTNPNANVYFWASYDFMYANLDQYTIDRTGTAYGNGNTYRQILDTKTFIHEMGHMFGLSDYYDYEYLYTPAGAYTMQDHNVSTHDPFSYIALNWADPYIPTETCTLTIGDFPTTHDVILLTPEWNDYDSAFDEYILLELYSLTGLNEHYKGDWFHGVQLPDGVGIRVWHVDARLVAHPHYGFSEENITSNTDAYGYVYKVCDNTHRKINDPTSETRGSYICENQNMLQLISRTQDKNYGLLDWKYYHFVADDLFREGDSFTLDNYKKQFINIDTGEFYTAGDTNIKLNNRKKLNWSFTVNDITTKSDGSSTAVITLNKLA